MFGVRSVSSLKKEKIAHLNWCLEKLKFHDTGTKDEDYEYLYRFIFEMVATMSELSDKEALEYYHQKVMEGKLTEQLKKMNIEWNC